jgi:hypothetical protein
MTDLEEARRAQGDKALTQILSERKKARLQKPKRRRMSITLSLDSYAWLRNKVSVGDFYNLSDGIERCVKQTRTHQSKKDE